MDKRTRFTTNLLDSIKMQLKIQAAKENVPANELLEKIIMDYINRQFNNKNNK